MNSPGVPSPHPGFSSWFLKPDGLYLRVVASSRASPEEGEHCSPESVLGSLSPSSLGKHVEYGAVFPLGGILCFKLSIFALHS